MSSPPDPTQPGFRRPRDVAMADTLDRVDTAETLTPDHADTIGASPAAAGATLAELSATARLGRFYVLHKLGEGGMGTVYVAYDEALDRRVAIKLLRRGTATREWLLREAQALGRLAHPNVVAVHEVGEADGRVFLAMELVEGPTLRAWLDEEPRPFGEVLRLFREAGRGLGAAHDAGMVHRDFKPDNVLVGRDGRARVVDFGIAALDGRAEPAGAVASDGTTHSPSSALASPLTQQGTLMGTPAFMSPEQFRGERATAASDQWSFCVALYRAIYGTAPFPDGDLAQLSEAVRNNAPTPPPRNPDVPPWLGPILLRGLARDPAARFPSLNELLAAIERHLPRDPERDATVVARERNLLSGVFLLSYVAQTVPLVVPRWARALLAPRPLVWLPAAFLLLTVGVVALRWRFLARNRYGRSLAAMFPAGAALACAHRAVGLHLGMPVAHILVDDMLILCAFYAAIAILEEPWVIWLALIPIVGAMVATGAPDRAPLVVGLGGVASLGAMMVRLWLDRHVRPAGHVGTRDGNRPSNPSARA